MEAQKAYEQEEYSYTPRYETDTTSLAIHIHYMEKRFDRLEESLKELRGDMKAGFEKIDARFEKIDTKFEKLNSSILKASGVIITGLVYVLWPVISKKLM